MSQVEEATRAVRAATGDVRPQVAIILGSGLAGMADQIDPLVAIPYAAIPHFARPTAAGHSGRLILGVLEGVPVVVMSGRLHRYEGWSTAQVTFPVELMAALGAETLIASNASGGLRQTFCVGEIMVIRDHLNWIPDRTPRHDVRVRGTNPYDDDLARVALAAGRQGDFVVHQGTYLATLGPTYETRAEYRMMRRVGADCVGMSTVPEVLEAQRQRMRVLALSMISNVARPDTVEPTSHEEVLLAGRGAEPRMSQIIRAALRSIAVRPEGPGLALSDND